MNINENGDRVLVGLDKNNRMTGIMQVADELNCSYNHLIMVVSGKRKSESLMARINKLHPELIEVYKTKKGIR